VCIDTKLLIVVVAPRAPAGLEVEHVEVMVLGLHLVQEVDRDLVFSVSEGAHLPVLTVVHVVRIRLAKLALVLLWVVEFFNPIMGLLAALTMAKALEVVCSACDLPAHLAGVVSKCPSPVLFIVVVVETSFWIMLMHVAGVALNQRWARFRFKFG
jgi:hypothetical protein